jgi:hypothetical protein
MRRSQDRTFEIFLGRVIPEPVLAGLVAPDDRMSRIVGVMARVLRWRRVATADVTARSAAAQVEPPAARGEALAAARAARRYRGINPDLIRLVGCRQACLMLPSVPRPVSRQLTRSSAPPGWIARE